MVILVVIFSLLPPYCLLNKDFAENQLIVFTVTHRYCMFCNTRQFLLTARILDPSFPQNDKVRRLGRSCTYQERTFANGKLSIYIMCTALFVLRHKQTKHCLLQSQPHDEAPLAAVCVSQLSEGLCEQELVAAVSCMQIAEICQSHVREIFFDLLRN